MLDVHPPHAPTHTWRDFLLHIATIVIGLLIAIGLEQSVEYLHHRRQLAETREALRIEPVPCSPTSAPARVQKLALDIAQQSTTLWLWIRWVQPSPLCLTPPGGP
jgi:hypothetical protein